eukprot:SAG31_NODE_4615_length_3094_cov_1.935559_1_plen_40_part_10
MTRLSTFHPPIYSDLDSFFRLRSLVLRLYWSCHADGPVDI